VDSKLEVETKNFFWSIEGLAPGKNPKSERPGGGSGGPGQASGAGRLASRRTAVSAAGRGSLVLPLAVTGTQ